jgi:predicted outer membrane repeat protein
VFAPALSGQSIVLTNGQLVVNHDLLIDASSLPGGLAIDGDHNSRIFQFQAGSGVIIGLTFTNGYAYGSNGAALYVADEPLIVVHCTFAGNSAIGASVGGGAILNTGTMIIEESTFSGNGVDGSGYPSGGAIYNSGTMTVEQSTFFGNTAGGSDYPQGGAICDAGTLTVNESTFYNNSSSYGGALLGDYDTLTLNQCTICSNYDGGGVASFGTVNINQSTICGNNGGLSGEGAQMFVSNSIVAGNQGSDIDANIGNIEVAGSNIVENIFDFFAGLSGPAPINAAPDLAPLGNYGGPTQTMPPLPGSPAIDSGSNSATNQFATDQRGFPRLSGAGVDIGAVEFQYGRIVSSAADSGDNTLRADLVYAPPGSTLTFAPTLSGQPIVLTSGEIVLSNNVIIDGRVPGGIQISGNNASRVFNITSGTVSLFGLTLTGGNVDPGGAIYSAAGTHLTMLDCTLTGNSGFEGGAILNDGPLSLYQCTFANNSSGYGGAFQARAAASVVQCTFANNSATYGGGIYVKTYGLVIWNTIVDGNSANSGGDITIERGYSLTYDGPDMLFLTLNIENGSTTLGPAPIPGPRSIDGRWVITAKAQRKPCRRCPVRPLLTPARTPSPVTFQMDRTIGLGFPRLVGRATVVSTSGAVEGVPMPGRLHRWLI